MQASRQKPKRAGVVELFLDRRERLVPFGLDRFFRLPLVDPILTKGDGWPELVSFA
jgi:hypothetical protein